MLIFKKTIKLLLAFGSSAAFSGTMGPVCTPDNVTVPCKQSSWSVGAKALFLQANAGTSTYLFFTPEANNVQNFINTGTHWGWGFMVEGDYQFNTGLDLNLNWYHLNYKYSFYQPTEFTSVGSTATYSSGLIHPQPFWDAVNLELGQHVTYGQNINVRFYGGAQYAHLGHNRKNTLQFNPDLRAYRGASYHGIGPRAGIDASYGIPYGFAIYSKGAIGLLAGRTAFSVLGLHNNPAINFGRKGTLLITVPELEGKLGLIYNYRNFTLDAGWMWVSYINSIMNPIPRSVGIDSFGIQGPFAGLKWKGNIA